MRIDESSRLESLGKYRILDTDPEESFDDLALLASQVCGTPIALISLVDEERQWFKARIGIEARQTSRNVSFCARAMEQTGLFVIPDTHADERFRDNPLVTGEPRIRFYAGAPLHARDGNPLGTLCVIDHAPRDLSASQLEALSALRRQVEAQLELRRNLLELRQLLQNEERLGALVPFCSNCELDMVIPADLSRIEAVREGIRNLLRTKGWSDEAVDDVELALDETLSNAIRHGCQNDPSKHVQCLVSFDEDGEIVIVVRDPGSGFHPTSVPDPTAPDNLLKPGGRGVFLINQLMDAVEYSDQGRQVSMRKSRGSVDET